jgi:hypothetical protein
MPRCYELWAWFLTLLMVVGTAAFAWIAVNATRNTTGFFALIAGCSLAVACAAVALILGAYAARVGRARKRLARLNGR